MNIYEAIEANERFRMTYPIDHTYGNVNWIDPKTAELRIKMEDGSWFCFDLETFKKAEAHLWSKRDICPECQKKK